MFRRISLLAALVGFGLLCGAQAALAQPAFPLHTSGRFIVDSNGTRVRLNVFNWYGAEGKDYVVEGLEAQSLSSIVTTIKGLGFNAVRLLWSNEMYESNPVVGNYALAANSSLEGEHALTIFDTVVDALTNAGIMVILDNHVSNAGWCCSTTDGNTLWYNSQYPESSWIADWEGIVARYNSNPYVIGADLRNEPRGSASWGGNASTDWHAAAQRGGNAVLSVNPNLLIFVEGVSYAGDLTGVASLPISLNVANRAVYEAHDYGFWYSNGFTSYSSYVNTVTPKWAYLVTGSNPQPLWIGEFGTCNNANTCVSSTTATDLGYWFQAMTSFVEQNGIDWSYWAVNGTTETGNGGGFGAVEGYGVLNTTWNGSALPALTSRLQSMMTTSPAFNLVANSGAVSLVHGAVGSATVAIVPGNGFTGTVNLSCQVSGGPGGTVNAPTCSVTPSVSITGTSAASATVSIATTGASAKNGSAPGQPGMPGRGRGAIAACAALFLGSLARRHRKFFAMLVLLAFIPLMACGGGGASANSSPGTSAGAYTVTVTGSATGASSATAQITVNVS